MSKGVRAARKEARPREILEAAFEEFSLRGYAATSMDHIANRVGVTKGTIYMYYDNKEDLFVKMVEELTQPSVDVAYYRDMLNEKPAIDVVHEFLQHLYRIGIEDYYSKEIIRFIIAEAHTFGDLLKDNREAFVKPTLEALRSIVREGCSRGEFRPDAEDLDPFFLASPVLGLNVIGHIDPENKPETGDFFEQHMRMMKRLLEK